MLDLIDCQCHIKLNELTPCRYVQNVTLMSIIPLFSTFQNSANLFDRLRKVCMLGCSKGAKGALEQHALKNVNNCWNIKITFYLEASGGQYSNLYINVVHFFNPSFI
jgi:hypothetical protein